MKTLLAPLFVALLISGCEQKDATDYMQRAQQALDANNLNSAVIELKNAAQLSPKDGSIRFLLGHTYLQLGQYPAAIKELERALAAGHDASQVIPLLSKTYKRTGEVKQLFKLTDKAKGLEDQERAQLKLYQIQAYIEQGSHDKAKVLITDVKNIAQSGVYGQLVLAYDFIIAQEFEPALLQLDEALSLYPNQAEALKLKAQLLLNTEQTEQGLSTYQRYVDAYPEEVDAQFLLARLYSQANQQEKAEPIVDKLLKDYPNQPILLQLKASARAAKQQHKEALALAEKALSLQPEDTTSRLIAGVSSYFLDDFEVSHTHLAVIASHLPASHPALRILADSQLRLGMSLDANETVKRFNNITEIDTVLAAQVGQNLLRQGEINKAKALLDKQPENLTSAQSLLNIGALKLSLNDVSGILNLEQALDAVANTEQLSAYQVEVTLAQAYLATKAYDKALVIADRWQASKEHKAQGYLLAATVYQGQKQIAQAKKQYQQALQLYPDNLNLQLALINVAPLDTTEKREQALAQVSALIEQEPNFLQAIIQHFMLTKWLGKEEQMTQHLINVIEQNPENTPSYKVALGKMYAQDNKIAQAITVFESLKTQQPQAFWSDLANAYIANGEFIKAKQLYSQWFESTPNDPNATAGMIKVHSSQGNYNSALNLADHYLKELGGNSLEIRLLQTQLLIQTNQYEQAQAALFTYPDNAKSLPFYKGLLGQIQVHNNQDEAAISNLTQAYQANPTARTSHYLANAITNVKGSQAALTFLQQHVQAQPQDQLNTLRVAQMLTGNDNSQAQDYYLKVLEINPDHYIANNNLANLYLMTNKLNKAREHARKALDVRPENVDVLDTMASIETKLGQPQQALKYLNQAFEQLKQQPNDVIFYNYVETLIANNEMPLLQRRLGQYQVQDQAIQEQIEALLTKHNIAIPAN